MSNKTSFFHEVSTTVEVNLSEIGDEYMANYLRLAGYTIVKNEGDTVMSSYVIGTPITGSIQDAELAEAVTEAYHKHGYNLLQLIRNL